MASILSNSLLGGKKINDNSGTDSALSKTVELGGSYRIIFPKIVTEFGTDLAAVMVPGRVLDNKVFKSSFVPFKESSYTVNDFGDVVDNTGLAAWARISRVLLNAQCSRELSNAEAEAQKSANDLGVPIDQKSLERTLEGIKLKYHGGEAADGTRIYPTANPLVSGLKKKLCTRLLVIKVDATGKPDFKAAKYASLELSKARVEELALILNNPEYINEGENYIEVAYSYIGADKKSAGQKAKFDGLVKTMTLKSQYPTEWAQYGQKLVDSLVVGNTPDEIAEFIRNKNMSLRSSKSVQDIVSQIRLWCASNIAVFTSIDYTSEEVERAAADFLETHLVDSIPKSKAQFEAVVAEKNSKAAEESADTTQSIEPAVDEEQQALNEAARLAEAGAARSIMDVAQNEQNTDYDPDSDGLGGLED